MCFPFIGGTIDVTCNEVQESRELREVWNASGGSFGGTMINEKILKHIRVLFGNKAFDEFINKKTASHMDILTEIEEAKLKNNLNENSYGFLPITLPGKEVDAKKGK